MKQLLQNLRSGETYITEIPKPTAKPGMAVIQTAASLVSAGTERMLVEFAEKSLVGKARSRPDLVQQVLDKARREGLLTTLEAALNRLDQPMVLGYSSAGTISELGSGLQGFQVGDRVACAGGGFAVHAEFAVVPKNLIVPIPDQLEFEQAAFGTLGAIAMHGFRLASPQIGETVAVIGLGILGLLVTGISRAAGCQVIGIDLDPARVKLGETMGAKLCVLRSEAEQAAQSFSQGHGIDAVLICADTPSADPVQLAGAIARDRARVVAVGAVGLDLPRKQYYEKEISFINSRSYGPGRYDHQYEENGHDYPIGYVRWTEGRNLEAVIQLMASSMLDVKPLITHRFPISQAPRAYDLITGKNQEPFLGVLLTYPQTDEKINPSQNEIPQQTPVEKRSPLQTSNRVQLGVIGAGNFATAVMLPAVSKIPEIQLRSIASAAGVSASHAAEKFGFRQTANQFEDLLTDPDINTIAILTRHNLHASQILAGLRAGKHVFCEKPLAISRMDLDNIALELAEVPLNQKFTVGFNRRFAPLAQQLYKFLENRQEPATMLYRINAGPLPSNHWLHDPEQGGGRIIGEGCHFIDFLCFLVGSPPISVQAVSLADNDRSQEDNVVLSFTFPDGSVGTISYLANGDRSFSKERIEVFCGGRVAVLDDFRSLEMIHKGKKNVSRSRLRQDKGHRAIWEVFSQSILQEDDPPIPYNHLLGVSRASFKAVEAIRGGIPQKIED